jgi:AraC family transcriptional regulator of adaptative response / DNA-3-methyladenine glycosylase II
MHQLGDREFDACYAAVQSRDARFDGWFVTAVTSTGIYCRPSCPARTPGPTRVRFYPTAAAAQVAGFRACKRCRPDASPGSPAWNLRADTVARAMRLIADGVVDREGVGGLARRLGYSERHLHRILVAELGAGPVALARAQRATTARVLIESSSLPFSQVAFAAGFASIRMFNETVQSVFAMTPTELRRTRRSSGAAVAPGTIPLRLPVRRPFAGDAVVQYFHQRSVPGLEDVRGGAYQRSLRLPNARGTATFVVGPDHVTCALRLEDLRDLTAAVGRARQLFDLDADPEAVDAALARDSRLRPLVRATPGRRVPGTVDPFELAVRAVIGQQISLRAASTVLGRLTYAHGSVLAAPDGAVTHVFPSAAELVDADPASFPMPRRRAEALHQLALAVANQKIVLEGGHDRDEVRRDLQRLDGIGPWTAGYIAMRALGDADVFLASDLGVRHAMDRLGEPAGQRAIEERSQGWRPWRSYAMQHLWASLGPDP